VILISKSDFSLVITYLIVFATLLPDSISICPVTQCVHSPSLYVSKARAYARTCSCVCVFMDDIYAACENCEGYTDTRNKDHKGQRRCRCNRAKAGADFERIEKSSTCLSTGDLQSPSMVSRIERTRGHVFSLLLSSATFPFFYCLCDPPRHVGSREESLRKKQEIWKTKNNENLWMKYYEEYRYK